MNGVKNFFGVAYGHILLILFIMSSCGKRVYTSGTYGSIKSYTARPEYRGENKKAIYISADFSNGNHDITNDIKDTKTLLSFSAHRSITHKYFNFYYGLGGTIGNYRFDKPIKEDASAKSKQFYSLNSKTGINFNLPTKKMDWRLIGFELAYNYEFGPFQNTLESVKNNNVDPELLIFNKKSMLSYNLTSEAVFKLSSGNAFSLGFYIGDLLNKTGDLKGMSSEFTGIFMSYKLKAFTFSYLIEGGQANISSSKFGLSYQLF